MIDGLHQYIFHDFSTVAVAHFIGAKLLKTKRKINYCFVFPKLCVANSFRTQFKIVMFRPALRDTTRTSAVFV